MQNELRTRIASLTIWEPWATLIAHGVKTVENRTWRPSPKLLRAGDPLIIHAGQLCDRDALAFMMDVMGREEALEMFYRVRCGCVLAVATYWGCDTDTRTKFDVKGQKHWRLGNVIRAPEPFHMIGHQGIYFPDFEDPFHGDEVEALLRAWEHDQTTRKGAMT